MSDRLQVPVVKNMVEHIRAATPCDFFRLHGLVACFGKLPDQRVMLADIEIPAEQCGAIRVEQLFDNELALFDMLLA